jgi:formylglycine-generating enzyme required for sulfatase activity
MRQGFFLWLLPFWLFATTTYSQQHDFYGNQVGQELCRNLSYMPDEQVQNLVNRIVEAANGLGNLYIPQPCPSVHNCVAIADESGRPYILYNPNFLARVKGLNFTPAETPTASDWDVLHVLAHEVAHHLRNHLTDRHPDKTDRDLELEADETAGYILYLLGAPGLSVAQRALESAEVPENGSYTHSPRSQRLASFRTGWEKAETKFPGTGSSAPGQTSLDPAPGLSLNSPATYMDEHAGTFVLVEGGSFDMGCTPEQQACSSSEKPVHRVTLHSYYIGQYELTQAQWRAVMGNNPSHFQGCDQCPVEKVSWEDVQDFIRRLNELTGQNYRLPTEAEWEFAARGGNKSQRYQYAGGSKLVDVAWYAGNAGSKSHPVGQKRANELGLYDMSGNVREWCQDFYGEYPASAQTNPRGLSFGFDRVARGGSWYVIPHDCRVAARRSDSPGFRFSFLGFRLAMTP